MSNNSFDFLNALKKAEPIAFLASLSLVIAAFTFQNVKEGFGTIYNYAIVSAFLFIFSFLFSIVTQWAKAAQERDPAYKFIYIISNFGTYFFSLVGILNLLLIAIEFGKFHKQLISTLQAWFSLFIGLPAFYATQNYRSKIKTETGEKNYYAILLTVTTFYTGICFTITAFILLSESVSGWKFNYPYDSIFWWLGFAGLAFYGFLILGKESLYIARPMLREIYQKLSILSRRITNLRSKERK